MIFETENGARANAHAHKLLHGHRQRLIEVTEKELGLDK